MWGTNKKLRESLIICLMNEKKKHALDQTNVRDTELLLLKITV